MLSRKNYVAVAKILRDHHSDALNGEVDRIVDDLAEYFAQDNPRFDSDRFRAACRDS